MTDDAERNGILRTLWDSRQLAELDEVAGFLRVAPRTVRRLIDRGEILSVKVGGRRFVPVSAVEKYLDRIESEAESKLEESRAATE